jgi:cell division protein FtsX
MRQYFLGFFIIALLAELVTTLFQRFRAVTDVTHGLYYSSFQSLLLERLLVWIIVFALLSGIWALWSKTK